MFDRLQRILIGKPLDSETIDEQKYTVLSGIPILSSDAISSVAYAVEEILLVLVPAIGILAYGKLTFISLAIIGLLVLLTFSYRQTIDHYPNGGGAYIVAKDNLGAIPGVTAGSALLVDYVLTVAVSISSGTAAITSAFPELFRYRVEICLILILLLMLGNLRGVRESSQLFSLPSYAFMFAMVSLIVVGFFRVAVFHYVPIEPPLDQLKTLEPVTLFLLLRAFSSGCTALTGVEAVSNAIPNFKQPSRANAKKVLMWLSIIVFVIFGGTSLLANIYHVIPNAKVTILSEIASQVFGKTFMFYFIQATTALILIMASNTAYADFPLLLAVMSQDGFVPKQFTQRGNRLSFSNGIFALSCLAGLLIIIFGGTTHALIPLYAVGVFLSFTLSQTGMFIRWLRTREEHWHYKAIINGMGAVVTAITVLIIGSTKFIHGAWIVIILIPILIFLMLRIKNHYTAVAVQLRLETEQLPEVDIDHNFYRNKVIVPIDSINKSSIRALRYAKTITDHVTAFHVAIDKESGEKIRSRWDSLHTDIPLVVWHSPYRKIINPILRFIESEEYEYKKGDVITVILPQFKVSTWWHFFLHNQTRAVVQRELLKHKHIVIATMPLRLKDDDFVLNNRSK